ADVVIKTKIIRETPAQNALTAKLALERKKLSIMRQQLESGLGNVSKKDISTVEKEIQVMEKGINRKISLVAASRKLRAKRKSCLTEMLEEIPNLAKKLKMREKVGHPRLETDQHGLMETIKPLVIFGGAADEIRRP